MSDQSEAKYGATAFEKWWMETSTYVGQHDWLDSLNISERADLVHWLKECWAASRAEARQPLAAAEKLARLLGRAKVRYSHEHGEPDPTPGFPYEVAFSIGDWDDIGAAIEEFREAAGK